MDLKIKNNSKILSSFLPKDYEVHKVFDLSTNNSRNNFSELKSILCPICYFRYNIAYRPNTCRHCFCLQCIRIWTKIKKECPYCKKKFSSIICVS